jgi:hypothetical protein
MIFKWFKRKLAQREMHNQALAEWIAGNLEEMARQGIQGHDMANLRNPVDEEGALFVEMHFLTRAVIRKNPDLAKLFEGKWRQYLRDFNVAASLPRPGGKRSSVLFLAAYDRPWRELGPDDVAAGLAEDAGVLFFEELQKIRSGR